MKSGKEEQDTDRNKEEQWRMEHIGFEIKQAAKLVNRHIGNTASVKYAKQVTGTHGWILRYLYEHKDEDMFQKDIEKRFDIRRSSATGLLQLMEKNGLIYREPVDYDARLKRIVMTEKAISIHESISREIDEVERQVSRGLSEEEIRILLQVLDKVQRNLSSAERPEKKE
ncbi:MarR family winged helix-turn-helix transcriptional regulator [Qiania dongpingensis]|nr:MarR family transcriptional regulator [Qiania dongpingensis]